MSDRATREHDQDRPADRGPKQAPAPPSETSALAMAGTRLLTSGIVAQRVYQALVMIVLARLLAPKDFGIMALASVILETAHMLRDLGMSNALIHRREKPEETANVLFFGGGIISVILYGVILLITYLFPTLGGSEQTGLVAAVLALQLFPESLATVPRALAAKELNLARQVKINLMESGLNGAVAVVMALEGFGVWSLVGGALAGSVLGAAAWNIASSWRPSWRYTWRVAREMLGFGVFLSTAAVVETALDLYMRAVVGAALGVVALGFYELTNRTVTLVFKHGVVALGQRIALPAFCQVQEDMEQIRKWFLKILFYTCLLMAPLAAGLWMLADLVVPALFGEKWLAAVSLLRLTAPLVIIMPLMYGRPLYTAIGRGDTLLRLVLLRFVLSCPFLFIAARFSLWAACATEVTLACLFAGVNLLWIARLLGLPIALIARILFLGLVSSSYFILALAVLRLLWSYYVASWTLPALGLVTLLAALFHLAAIYWRDRPTFLEMCRIAGIPIAQSHR